jgi:beta-glucoside operon transcriptional antiterminator
MIIERIINNNVVVSLDDRGREIVAMGRGLAFQRRVGDVFDDGLAEKVFVLGTREVSTKFQQVVAEIPIEHILVTERIIALAKERYAMELHDSIYVTLPDHVSMALERHAAGMTLKNPMLLDIKRLYRDEYAVGEGALDILAEATGVRFEADEAAFIAMHFVNAQLKGDMSDIVSLTQAIDGILSITADHLGALHDEESISWYRFVTHVKFFAQRLVTDSDYADEEFELYDILKTKYPDAFACVLRIAAFVTETYDHTISKEEMAYLTIHVRRLSARNKG